MKLHLFIDGNVSVGGVVQDLVWRYLSWPKETCGGNGDGVCGPCSCELRDENICCS